MTAATLRVRELGFTYRGAQAPALDRIDLDLPAGEVLGLLGPSGRREVHPPAHPHRSPAGLPGLGAGPGRRGIGLGEGSLRAHRGRLRDAHLVRATHAAGEPPVLRRHVRPRHSRSDELLEAVGLLDDADTLGAHLSKGMGVRLNLARALLTDPELLFLDEPTSGLDPARAARVEEIIDRQRRRGGSVVVTTHDMVLAERACDRVGFIVDGRLVEVGDPGRMRRRHGAPEVLATWEGGSARFPLAGLADDEDFRTALRLHRVQSLHSQEADLAEVFLAVTGRSLG